jgi:hypothetical protein
VARAYRARYTPSLMKDIMPVNRPSLLVTWLATASLSIRFPSCFLELDDDLEVLICPEALEEPDVVSPLGESLNFSVLQNTGGHLNLSRWKVRVWLSKIVRKISNRFITLPESVDTLSLEVVAKLQMVLSDRMD